jgi:branched-chain amino acid transport system permease protein
MTIQDLVIILNMIALVFAGWFVDWSLKQDRGKKLLMPGIFILALILVATLPQYGPKYSVIMLTSIIMYIVLAVSWTMFSGPTGYASLAPAAFFGVGMYTSAILGKEISIIPVVIIGGLLSVCLAVIVGALTLRLKGIYFTIFTLGLVLLISSVLLWYEVKYTGTRGRFVISVSNETIFYVMLGIFVLLLITSYFIRRSKYGLALQSIGQYEEAAAHIGINVTAVKIAIFAISAFFMGMAGAIMTMRWTYIDPYSAFDLFLSFLPVLMAIFGGMKQFYGPVLGAAILAFLEEKLLTKYPYYYKLCFGIVLVVAILYMPDGITGVVQKIRERIARRKNALT